MAMTKPKNSAVFIVDAGRTPMVKYQPRSYRTMAELLAEPVQQIKASILKRVDTVCVTYRYPTPLEQRFDAEDFIEVCTI